MNKSLAGDSRDVLRFLKLFSRHETHKSSELVSSIQEIIRSLGIPILCRINHQSQLQNSTRIFKLGTVELGDKEHIVP